MKNMKFFNLVIIALTGFLTVYANGMSKQEMWDNMSMDIDHWTDGMGYPIDKGIKEVVVALNMMDVKTLASCEGHFDHGYSYPWIDIDPSSPEVEKWMADLRSKVEQIQNEEKRLEAKFPDLSYRAITQQPEAENLVSLYEEGRVISQSYEQAKINCLKSMMKLIDQFYENRNVSYDKMLVIDFDCGRIQSNGARMQIIRSTEEQNKKIVEYLEEMQAFASFLKTKFME